MPEAKEKKPIVKPTGKGGFNLDVEEMTKEGVHFGHRTSRVHPKIMPYLSGARNTVHIFDLEKTKDKLEEALKFIQGFYKEGKIILLVGTKVQIKDLVESTAKGLGLPYVSERWLGGTFTNFGVMLQRIEYLKGLETKKEAGEFDKYTKKERLDIDKEIKDLRRKFGGIIEMTRLPDAIFVCDMRKDDLAIKEAKKKGVKVIGIADTNVDPTLADYPIPANDDAISSVKYILGKLSEVIRKIKK